MTEPFGTTSTADQVLIGTDLSGRRVLVTGVSSGVGAETARLRASRGAQVIGAVRDIAKSERATSHFEPPIGGGLRLIGFDLASLASLRACADGLLTEGAPLDFIIANAGVMATPKGRTVDGFETQFGTKPLGHFVLINRIARLLPSGGRVVMVASAGH